MLWKRFNGETILSPIEEVIKETIIKEKNNGNSLKVCIGTDSQVKGSETEFATVILFKRESNGGFMFVNNENTTKKYNIKERMLLEVAKSIEVAYEFCGLFKLLNIEMEVHIDINPNPQFKSNEAFRDAIGYIMGMGFTFKAKPEAFASSCCANKIVN
jgi:hypothetical protein